jgi:hypothetical protein
MMKKKIDQIAISLSLGFHKGRPEASGEAFSAQIRTSSTSKDEIY